MTDPSLHNAAGAGLALVVTMLLCAGRSHAAGALAGAPVPFPPAGLFAGLLVGFALVYTRCKDS